MLPSTALPRILFLDHVGVMGGAELCLIDIAAHLRNQSKIVLMADGPLVGALRAVGAEVEVIPLAEKVTRYRRGSGMLGAIWTIPRVIHQAWKIARQAKRFDLIWANSQKAFVIGCFAAMFSRRKLVWHLHDILTADHFSPSNRLITVHLANLFASRVVAVSDAGRQSFIACGGRASLACVVYNGIDPAAFGSVSGNDGNRSELRKEFNIGAAPLLGVFGRLTAWKGQDVLIRALPALPGVHAVFVGEPLFRENEYADSIRKLAVDLAVADRAHFAGFRSDVAGAMSEVDLVVHTSTAPEPFGRVLVEAMLAKKPLIAAAAGGALEIATNNRDAILVEPGKPDLLAAAVRDLLGSPEKAEALKTEAFRTATTRFSLTGFLTAVDAVAAQVHSAAAPVGRPAALQPALQTVEAVGS